MRDEPAAAGQSKIKSVRRKSRRRKTSHLKVVPETRTLREQIRARCIEVASRLDKSHPVGKDEGEQIVRHLLDQMGLPEGYVGWTLVTFYSAFWQDQVAAVPCERCLFLLPHCLKHAEGCPADYDQFGLDCKSCGACSIADFRNTAEALGYKVLVAEGSPVVMKIIVSGYIDAIIGVSCLNVLEKAIDKILLAGIPCMAVPLLSSDCRNTSVDEEWVDQMIHLKKETPAVQTRSYVHLMRMANTMFEPDQLDRLAPRLRGRSKPVKLNGQPVNHLDPVSATETLCYDFLGKGGKHSRPFITLAVYDALTGAQGTLSDGAKHIDQFPISVKRAALSIETFHKASLVHDDIEDDDDFRYGDVTMHRKHGTPTAINVGDYMIGLGYRLISREASQLGSEVTADILDQLASAHMKLTEGQGAELLWRDSSDKHLKPIDALKIYALKTAPAFEAAMFAGLRLASAEDRQLVDTYREFVPQFTRHLGIAFQILNDLDDWQTDNHNKLIAGSDVLGGRPTVLWALAQEYLNDADREELRRLACQRPCTQEVLGQVRRLYESAGVFDKARRLVEKYQQRAEALADQVKHDEFRRLLYYLIDTVLDRQEYEPSEPAIPAVSTVSDTLPVITKP